MKDSPDILWVLFFMFPPCGVDFIYEILRRDKTSVPININTRVISYSLDNAKRFATIFTSISMSEYIHSQLLSFTQHTLVNISVTDGALSCHAPKKTTDADILSAVILRCINLKLYPILTNQFNRYLLGESFSSPEKVSSVSPVSPNAVENSRRFQYQPC